MKDPVKKYSVLIVEDDPGYQFLFQNAIAEINRFINIDLVFTGRQVIEFLLKDRMYLDLNRQEVPDLILANVKSEYFWLNDVEELRTYSQFNDIPLYLFSSYDSELFKNKALELGATGYYQKPDTFFDLKHLINFILRQNIV
jgi:DNA-binding response OmpR family regulator